MDKYTVFVYYSKHYLNAWKQHVSVGRDTDNQYFDGGLLFDLCLFSARGVGTFA
jgi:hypothetical protein